MARLNNCVPSFFSFANLLDTLNDCAAGIFKKCVRATVNAQCIKALRNMRAVRCFSTHTCMKKCVRSPGWHAIRHIGQNHEMQRLLDMMHGFDCMKDGHNIAAGTAGTDSVSGFAAKMRFRERHKTHKTQEETARITGHFLWSLHFTHTEFEQGFGTKTPATTELAKSCQSLLDRGLSLSPTPQNFWRQKSDHLL